VSKKLLFQLVDVSTSWHLLTHINYDLSQKLVVISTKELLAKCLSKSHPNKISFWVYMPEKSIKLLMSYLYPQLSIIRSQCDRYSSYNNKICIPWVSFLL